MLLVEEHKTTAEDITPGEPYWARLTLDPQLSMYIKGAKALGHDVDGVLYDVLRKPGLRPLEATPIESRRYTKDTGALYKNQRAEDETPEAYGERVAEAIKEDPNKYYQRAIIVRLQHEMEEADRDVWQTAGNIRDARRLNLWPRNPDSCKPWGRTCDYFSACTGTASITDPLLFVQKEEAHEELEKAPNELLTQSSLRCYRACPRRYMYRYHMRIVPNAPKAEPLRRGTSVHRALEEWSRTGGDLEAAITKLDRENMHSFYFERAMMIGYHARWGSPGKVIFVEAQFRMPLTNPETGGVSRTFELGGKIDKIVEVAR